MDIYLTEYFSWSWLGLAVDAVLIIWLVFSLFRGSKNGFVYSLIGMGTMVIAIAGAWIVSDVLADPVTKLFREGEASAIVSEISYSATRQAVRVGLAIVLALVIAILVKILGKSFSYVLDDLPIVGDLDQFLGAVFNLLVTLALILAILLAWESFFKESYNRMLSGAPITRFADAHNVIAEWFGRVK